MAEPLVQYDPARHGEIAEALAKNENRISVSVRGYLIKVVPGYDNSGTPLEGFVRISAREGEKEKKQVRLVRLWASYAECNFAALRYEHNVTPMWLAAMVGALHRVGPNDGGWKAAVHRALEWELSLDFEGSRPRVARELSQLDEDV